MSIHELLYQIWIQQMLRHLGAPQCLTDLIHMNVAFYCVLY